VDPYGRDRLGRLACGRIAGVGSSPWTLVVPVKPLDAAKTRLRGALPSVPHERLALALALDTVAAARECADVWVVSDDPTVHQEATALGARVLPDAPRSGLNAAVSFGAAHASRKSWVAALAADLPALRPAELAEALAAAAAEPGRSYVADASGTGTTLLAAPPGGRLDPRFGPGSAAAHAASGARALDGAWPTLRRDVDTHADLVEAARLGLGSHTSALVSPRWSTRGAPTTPDVLGARGRVADMQGTVASYDAATRSGTLLLDDGTEIAFPATAFEASGLRLLRVGQRLRIEHDESGQVTRVTLPTLS
jgi:2-phospho-L-lactate guanylyltransferase